MKSKISFKFKVGSRFKYYSSNRIATLIYNGCLSAIDEKVKNLVIFLIKTKSLTYKDSNDLIKKIILSLKIILSMIKRISKNGKNILNYSQTLLLVNF